MLHLFIQLTQVPQGLKVYDPSHDPYDAERYRSNSKRKIATVWICRGYAPRERDIGDARGGREEVGVVRVSWKGEQQRATRLNNRSTILLLTLSPVRLGPVPSELHCDPYGAAVILDGIEEGSIVAEVSRNLLG